MKKFFIKSFLITFILIIIIFITGKIIVNHFGYNKFWAEVIEIIDGDTVKIETGEIVRMLGINAPEINHPDLPEQKFAKEAKEYLKRKILNKKCLFEYERKNKYDVYGRILAFIYLNGKDVNAEMLKEGLAIVYMKSKNKKTKEYLMLENIARKQKKGLFSLIPERKINAGE